MFAGTSATTTTQTTTNQTGSAIAVDNSAQFKELFAPVLKKEELESFLLRVTSEAADIQKQVLYNFAQAIENNNKELKQLNQANADLSALLALFPKDGDTKTLKDLSLRLARDGKGTFDEGVMKDAVDKIFADPYGPLPEVKSTNTDSNAEKRATTAMNKYLALVQSGVRSGVIKPEDQTRYRDMSVTKADLTALQQAIKTQTDDRSNISSKLQLSVNQYNNNVSNITQFIANLQSIFNQNLKNVVGRMGG